MQKAAGFNVISWTILFCLVLHTTNTELTQDLTSSASSQTSDRYWYVQYGQTYTDVNISSTGSFSGPGGTGARAQVTVRMGTCTGSFSGLIVYGGQYIAIGYCSLQGPFEKSFNLTMYGTASIDGGGSDSSHGTLHVIVREKTQLE